LRASSSAYSSSSESESSRGIPACQQHQWDYLVWSRTKSSSKGHCGGLHARSIV
jgi:hypothetical protein